MFFKRSHACPSRDQLAEFSVGKLPEPLLDSIGSHLAACTRCASQLDTLQGDPSRNRIAAEIKHCLAAPVLEEASFRRLWRAARQLVSPHASTDARTIDVPGAEGGKPPAKRYGPYELGEYLGGGSMGNVYGAVHERLGRVVALKTLTAHTSPQARSRFRTEAAAVARLSHPNIVQIYEYGEQDGVPYYAMELAEGGTLADRLRLGPLDPDEAAECVRVLALAVDHAHAQKVIHRDLKPSNVVVTTGDVVKVADFGLAKLLDDDETATRMGYVIGTPAYMAPEQAEGNSSALDGRVDIYALGAILYETLTGQPPFKTGSREQTILKVRKEEPAPPSALRHDVPPVLEAICLHCLEKKRDKRYSTAGELAEDLGRWQRGEPTTVRPLSPLARLARWGRRRLVPVVALSFLLTTLGAALAAAYWLNPDRPLQEIEAEVKQARPVSLIPDKGPPRWLRHVSGRAKSGTTIAADGAFKVHTWCGSLIELLPNPQCNSYKFSARVRHDKATVSNPIGIYACRHSYPGPSEPIEVFVTLRLFNHFGEAATFPNGRKVSDCFCKLSTRICTEFGNEGKTLDTVLGGPFGNPFKPSISASPWHTLSMLVTPDKIVASSDGRMFGEVSLPQMASAIRSEVLSRRVDAYSPFLTPSLFSLDLRGGMGLDVGNGEASFCDVVFEPFVPQP